MLNWIFSGRKKWNPKLHEATHSNDIDGVRLALEKGADIDCTNEHGETALHTCVAMGNKKLLQLLLSRGANPNVMSERSGTPLTIAAKIGDRALPTVELLLAGRADPALILKVGPHAGCDVLGVAASHGANAILGHLLSFGATPKKQANGVTLMHLAAIGGDADTIALLIAAGLNVNEVDSQGVTPLQCAVSHGNRAVAAALGACDENPPRHDQQRHAVKDSEGTGDRAGLATPESKADESVNPPAEDTSPIFFQDAGDQRQLLLIREMSLLDFSYAYFPNVRFQNAIKAGIAAGSLPFDTVGKYLDAGESSKYTLLKLPNLGSGSVSRLNAAIDWALRQPLPVADIEVKAPDTKRQNLVDQLNALYPGVFEPLLQEYANTPISDRDRHTELEANILRLLTDERLAEVASRRFHGETLAAIASSLGVTRERVRQIESQTKQWTANQEQEPLDEAPAEPELPVPEGLNRKWYEAYLRLQAYKIKHGSADVPNQWSEDTKLAAWVSHQRQKYKKSELTSQQIELLQELEFSWSLRERGTWDDRLAELLEFRDRHGHLNVPTNYPPAPKLRQFIASSRYQFKTGTLDMERLKRLKDAGLILESLSTDAHSSTREFANVAIDSDLKLSGQILTFTGRLETLTQSEATELARKNGATVVDKFSGNVTLVVVGSDPGSKLDNAQRSGVLQINEKQFIDLLN